MSGCGYEASCPNCGDMMSCYTDHKPFDNVSGDCSECGFHFFTKSGQLTLEELNDNREEQNTRDDLEGEDRLEPLTKLPELKNWL